MTIDLVDGKAGKAHIDSDDRGSFNIGTMGPGCYVLNVKNKLKLTMDSANNGTVDTGGLIMWGRYVHCTEPETITVKNGSQNMKRNDLVVMRYTKTTDKIETASLVVIKGTPAASTPADPQINEVDEITSTTTIADMPLYRIPLDGITVGTPVPLFNVLAPMSELWDSVSHVDSVDSTWAYGVKLHYERIGNLVICNGYGIPTSDMGSGARVKIGSTPNGFLPKTAGIIAADVIDGRKFQLEVQPDGTVLYTSTTGVKATYMFIYSGCWIAEDEPIP